MSLALQLEDAASVVSLPSGGGALRGIGEKFSPDLYTGTCSFTVPISLPTGRHGLHPDLNLVYNSANGNGAFGLGWQLSVPGISRKTSMGVPRYNDHEDTFILSGAEDLVPISGNYPGRKRYIPRTEGLFALIEHQRDADKNIWEVRSKDGLVSSYGGNKAQAANETAVIAKPVSRDRVFSWKLTETRDPFGNVIEYEYLRDRRQEGPRDWDQLYLRQARYIDYRDDDGNKKFLVTVSFIYEVRPDPFSDYRAGFEIRTRLRCRRITVETHAESDRLLRTYDLVYLDMLAAEAGLASLPLNSVSLLSQIRISGHDGDRTESLAPLEFHYTNFAPDKREFASLHGPDLPTQSLANDGVELVDLFGRGLPDLVEMNGMVRYWRNLGDGRFALPRVMHEAPATLSPSDTGSFIDANGDGRPDLLVTNGTASGYFPLKFGGYWDRKSFQKYPQAPSFSLNDPEVKLVDLDGDGVTDAIRSGTRLECFFNDPIRGWNRTRWVDRQSLDVFPNVNFSDPRVKWADFSGDGLQDVALVYDGNIEYWPNLGHGDWGKRIHMENSPRFPYLYDPKRILIGDVDGDGLADVVYVEDGKITLWINQCGNRWSDPITISGTPSYSDMDSVRLVDMLGTGISGVLWSRDASVVSHDQLFFLDFTSGLKPYLLSAMDNHMGAITRVEYTSSTRFFLQDEKRPETRWKTTLPFPVQVVSRVEVVDYFSRGKLSTEYKYHDGYWDGAEREFRGFGMVEQKDTESFADQINRAGEDFPGVPAQFFSAPTLKKTWFHQSAVGDEFGEWRERDLSQDYWNGNPNLLRHTERVNQFLQQWPNTAVGRRTKRDALRTLRGSILRTELYALDESIRADRPYIVSEFSYGLAEIEPPAAADPARRNIFFPHLIGTRTTQWDRGDDPMTRLSFTDYTNDVGDFDPFGRPVSETQVACPRGWRRMEDKPAAPYLATRTSTVHAQPIDAQTYIHTCIAKSTTYEILDTAGKSISEFAVLKDSSPDLRLRISSQTLSFYDGEAFVGLPIGQLDRFGVVTRIAKLMLTDDILQQAFGPNTPPYIQPSANTVWTADYPPEFRTLLSPRGGYLFQSGSAHRSDPRGYFVNSTRTRYDFQTNAAGIGRGLTLETRDPLHDASVDATGHRTRFEYDDYQLFATRLTDGAGMTTEAAIDYRVCQVKEMKDSNGNRSRFSYSPLGLLETTTLQGKSDSEGDQLRPSIRLEHDFNAFDNSPSEARRPIFVRTIRHVHHDTEVDVTPDKRGETIVTIEYSDGFGRLLQTRTQGEELRYGDANFGGGETVLPLQSANLGGNIAGRRNSDQAKPNVVVSGWCAYDNKGRPVEKYEPFFSEGWDYAAPVDTQMGEKITISYDPCGRSIRQVHADGSQQLTITGVPGTMAAPDLAHPEIFEPTPWETYTYDPNDNAGRTHSDQASSYQHYWNTPASTVVDALGRTIKSVQRNRDPAANGVLPPVREVSTRMTYDIRGNVLAIADSLGRKIIDEQVHDLGNRKLRLKSIDAGLRTTMPDAMGNVIEQRDGKGALILHAYDNLNRPVRLWARDAGSEKLTLRERFEYGDAGVSSQPLGERDANRAANRLGRLSQKFDEAGSLSFDAYDFKGNVLQKTRRVVSDAAILDVFSGPPPAWKVAAFRVDWANPVPLDAASNVSNATYNALNRVKLLTYPRDVENGRAAIKPQYNRAGALERVEVVRTVAGAPVTDAFVERITYNARRQRVLVAYGNGTMTRCAYDPHSLRLRRTRTERFIRPAELTYAPAGDPFQETSYDYDLIGNILAIHDRAPSCGLPATPNELDRMFVYDALYRLCSATGRECDVAPPIPPNSPWDDVPRCTDITRARRYSERYLYDDAGNLLELKHTGFDVDGTPRTSNRNMVLVPDSNRLSQVKFANQPFNYVYDDNGNLTQEGTTRHFEWDHSDRLRVYRTQLDGSEPSVYTHYLYDGEGRRLKKVTRKQGGVIDVTVYVDGIFELHRRVRAGQVLENNTLHVMDNQSRIATIRAGDAFAEDNTPAVKYHIGDHLGSSNVVLDNAGNLVNREEFTPYGETSFGSFAMKRYRFSAKERDEESGLSYHGARYYAPWLCRWTSCDPLGTVDGLNLYQYVRSNPLMLVDPSGLGGELLPGGAGKTPEELANGAKPQMERETPDEPPSTDVYDLPDAPPPDPEPSEPPARVPPMRVPYTYAPHKSNILPPVQEVDTGSEVGNVLLSIWASGCNLLAAIPNTQAYGRDVASQTAHEAGKSAGMSDTDFAALDVYMAAEGQGTQQVVSEAAQGLQARIVSGVAKKELVNAVKAPVYAAVGAGGVGGGAKTPIMHDHHIFPQQLREAFRRIGIDVDKYTITISAKTHMRLHSGGTYNWEWEEYFYGEGAKPTYDGAFEFAQELLAEYGVKITKKTLAHPYRQ